MMNVIERAREARHFQQRWLYGWPKGFFAKLLRKEWINNDTLVVQLLAFRENIEIEAFGRVAKILDVVLCKLYETYYFSGLECRERLLATIGTEVTPRYYEDERFEFIANVEFLSELVETRLLATPKDIKQVEQERFYVEVVVANVTTSISDNFYQGCTRPNPECYSKKVEQELCDDGKFRYYCPRCKNFNKTFIWRVMPKLTLEGPEDEFNGYTITAAIFKESAEKLFGKREEELVHLMIEERYEELNDVLEAVIGSKILMRLRAREFESQMSLSVDYFF